MWKIFRIFVKHLKSKIMDQNTSLKFTLLFLLIGGFIAVGLSMNHSKVNITKAEESYLTSLHKQDSLKNVIDSLQTEIFTLEDGFDSKEHRYEDVLFEYELGISYLKDYHPKAYKDFHRIIAHKEKFSHELERENTKRLNAEDL
jgi:hypothetical protein